MCYTISTVLHSPVGLVELMSFVGVDFQIIMPFCRREADVDWGYSDESQNTRFNGTYGGSGDSIYVRMYT